MNIFYIDQDPKIAAQMMCDKHVVKMVLESAQLLCTAHNYHEYKIGYKPTHKNHPSAKWVREQPGHYTWLYSHFRHLLAEYTFRYGKRHKCADLTSVLWMPPQWMLDEHYFKQEAIPFTPPPQCMPDEYKLPDTVEAYRKYYRYGKAHILKYTKREMPEWLSTTKV